MKFLRGNKTRRSWLHLAGRVLRFDPVCGTSLPGKGSRASMRGRYGRSSSPCSADLSCSISLIARSMFLVVSKLKPLCRNSWKRWIFLSSCSQCWHIYSSSYEVGGVGLSCSSRSNANFWRRCLVRGRMPRPPSEQHCASRRSSSARSFFSARGTPHPIGMTED